MIPVLRDADVRRRLHMPSAIAAVRQALAARRAGTLAAPPRHHVPVGPGSLVFTVGGDAARAGFRVYDRLPGDADDQLTAVWDTATGAMKGVVLGSALGAVRTGAIGGVAIDVLARPDAAVCAILGAGRQARTQLLAAAAVRPLRAVRVFSRTPASREAYAEEMAARTGLPVVAVDSARAALDGADLVLSATTASAPVFSVDDVPDGCHVTVAGPKFASRHEWDPALAERAALVVTDSPDQLRAYPEPFLLAGTPQMDRIQDLAALDGARPTRGAADVTLFVSTGLAGTEVFVAEALLDGPRPWTRGNLYADADAPPTGEAVAELVRDGSLAIERIVSSALEATQAYDQATDEWVVLLRGTAELTVAGEPVALAEGDWLWLPAGTPHTVERTSKGALWLATHTR